MSDDAQSKRARQKERREAKLAEQRRQASKSRRNRMMMFGVVGLLILGLIGLAVWRNYQQNQEAAALAAAVEQKLADLGCTPAEEREDFGASHFEGAEEITANPPPVVYTDRPPTSGRHHPNWVKTGFYDVRIDERFAVHNLEHGYVFVWYDSGAAEDDMTALQDSMASAIDGDYPKTIAADYGEDLPEDKNFSFTAWNMRQDCEQFDSDVLNVFLRENHSGAGDAPEKQLPAHLEAGNGTLDPEGNDLLLPPLGDAAPTGGMTELPTEGGATEGAAPPTEASS